MNVMKFGGTSVGKPERMKQIVSLVAKVTEPKMVVLSALSGTTNSLVEIGDRLAAGKREEAKSIIDHLETHYHNFLKELFTNSDAYAKGKAVVDEHFEFLNIILKISFNESLQKDILAQGELLSTKIFCTYLEQESISHALIPATNFMSIDANNEPHVESIREKLQIELAKYPGITLFVTQGFICKNAKGEMDNLKRGGSDYTASLIAAALQANVCEIWTDIDGMHNNDPRIVKETHPIEILSFEEAAELAYFGAKILHPASIWPAQTYNIPVKLLNTMQPDAKGTTIVEHADSVGVKAVAAKDNITAIRIKSSRMLLAYGFLRKIFEIFEQYKTSIDMVTTSEVAVSVTIDDTTFLQDIVKDLAPFGTIEIDSNQVIVAVVGNEIAKTETIVKKLFASIANTPIRMVSYGGSPHNISLLVDGVHKEALLKQLNKGMFGMGV